MWVVGGVAENSNSLLASRARLTAPLCLVPHKKPYADMHYITGNFQYILEKKLKICHRDDVFWVVDNGNSQ